MEGEYDSEGHGYGTTNNKFKKAPKDRSYPQTLSDKLKPLDTIPYVIIVIALKYAFNLLTIIQTIEFIFLLSTFYIVVILPYVSFWKKDYILGIHNKDAGLSVAYWLALFIMIDFFCLKALPLLSKVSVMSFILTQCNFELQEGPGPIHIAKPAFKLRKPFLHHRLTFIVQLVMTLIAITIDIFVLDIFEQNFWTIVQYALVMLLLISNTLYVFLYKIKPQVYAFVDREHELIKIKWLTHLIMAFFSPILVFLFNQTSNYSIMHFQGNIVIICLIVVAALLHFTITTFKDNKSIDINHTNLKRVNTTFGLIILAGVSYLFLGTQGAWIINKS